MVGTELDALIVGAGFGGAYQYVMTGEQTDQSISSQS